MTTPRQLPKLPAPFVDREPLLADMERIFAEARQQGRPALLCLDGKAGVGKTGTVIRFCQRQADLFPDGVYYVKIGDAERDGLASVDAALEELLHQLGCEYEQISRLSRGGREAQLRSRLTNQRAAIVLDDVGSPAQVVPFVPATAGCALIVTSRSRIAGLRSHDFAWLRVEPLAEPYGYKLFTEVLGKDRQLDPTDARAILRACGGLPLVIKVTAAQLAAVAGPRLSRAVRRFVHLGLAALDQDARGEVTAQLDLVYHLMDPELASGYRRLALHPGPEFGPEAAAVLLGLGPYQTEELLEQLLALDLLEADGAERYRFHDVLRWHAYGWALVQESPTERQRIFERVGHWYLANAVRHDRVLSGRWRVGPLYNEPAARPDPTRSQALDWLETELPPLLATAVAACEEEYRQYGLANQLCEALWGVCHLHGHHDTLIASHLPALATARAVGDDLYTMRLASQLASAYLKQGERAAAREHFQLSADAAGRVGHLLGEQSALEWLGKVAAADRETERALACYRRSEAVAQRVPDPEQRARMLALLGLQRGRLFNQARRFTEAYQGLGPTLDYFTTERPEPDNRAKTLLELGRALIGLERADEAVPPLETAVSVFAADGSHQGRATGYEVLADAAEQLGDAQAVRDRLRPALDHYTLLGDAEAMERISRRLAGLE